MRLHVLKLREVPTTNVAFISGDAADVVRIFSYKIAVKIVQCLSHLGSVLLIDAEDDCFSKAIGLLHELGEMSRDRFRASTQRNDSLKILCLIFVVRNLATVSIKIVFARTPTGGIPFGDYTVNAIRREKSIVDALPQTVLVDRVSEVAIRVAVVITKWRCCHPELHCRLEVFKNLTPVAFIASTAAMTFIDDD